MRAEFPYKLLIYSTEFSNPITGEIHRNLSIKLHAVRIYITKFLKFDAMAFAFAKTLKMLQRLSARCETSLICALIMALWPIVKKHFVCDILKLLRIASPLHTGA